MMGVPKPLRILARRPLCYPRFTRKFLKDLNITERFRPEEILYLTPNKRRARSAEFEILSLYQGSTAQAPDCLTLRTLAEKLVSARAEKGILDERDRRYILLKLIHDSKLFHEEHLGLLSELYAELKRHYPEGWDKIPGIAREVIFDNDTALRLAEALGLLEDYEEHLAERDIIDHEMLLAQAALLVSSLRHKIMIVEGYFEPWIAEQRLFEALINHIPEIVIIVPEDSIAAKGEEFFLQFELAQRVAPSPATLPETLWHRYPSREDEVVAIARRICVLVQQEEVNPGEIIIIFPALENYRSVVHRVFLRYGLKVDCSIRPRLDEQPRIRQVLDLLHVSEQGFRRRDVVGLLLAPGFTRVPGSVRRWIDALSRDEGIISGQTQWEYGLGSAIPRFLKNKPGVARIASVIREYMAKFIKGLKQLGLPMSVRDFTTKLKEVLEWLGWDVADEVRQGFEEALEKLCRMTELTGEGSISPSFIRETLQILFQKELPESANENNDAVRVIPVVESRWLDARYIFVGGLVDGEFPRHPRRDLLVPERLRIQLGLPCVEDEFINAEFEFRRLVSMAEERVFLSAPLMEGDRPQLVSVFLEEREEDALEDDDTVYCEEERQILQPLAGVEFGEGASFNDEASLKLINNRFDSKYPFKVTHLETYQGCPYRYYLGTVLGIEPAEEPTQEPEARLLGTVMHEVLEDLFKRDPDPDRLEEGLWNSLSGDLDRRRLNPFLRLWVEDWVRMRLDWLCDVESARREEGWKLDPRWLERDLEHYFIDKDFRLKGRVDRVDWQGGRARVIDYKTGKEKYFKSRIEKGESLQLPLYCEMIKKLYQADIVSFGMYGFQESKIEEYSEPEAVMVAAVDIVSELVKRIRGGDFRLKESQSCRYCEFNEFC